MDEAERCDKVGLIIDGQLVALDTPSVLKQQFNAQSIEDVFIKAEEGKTYETYRNHPTCN